MKIGDFSKKHNVTIDTIRHYIDLGLIIPEKDGAHFDFDRKCSYDMEEIKWLKKLKFSLAEIQRLFVIRRLTRLEEEEDKKYYRDFFIKKKNDLIHEREKINEVIAEIDTKTQEFNEGEEKGARKLGVPVLFLSILRCPKCGGTLILNSAQIDNNMVTGGMLDCRCGFAARIEDGIIDFTDRCGKNPKVDIPGGIQGYIENTAPEYINFIYRAIEWMIKRVHFNSEAHNIILEPGAGTGFFLKHIYKLLPADTFYIPVDHDIEALRYLKRHLEIYSKHTNFIFICCDFSNIPIKDDTIDLVFDFFGSTNYNFRQSTLLMDLLDSKVKRSGKWNGVYFCLDKYSKTVMQYPPECRSYFYKDSLLSLFEGSSFKMQESADLGYVNRAGEAEPFFIEGDNLHVLAYYGFKVSG